MVISATIVDLAISGATVRISNFLIQIWILLENPVQTQVRSSQLENISRPPPKVAGVWFSSSLGTFPVNLNLDLTDNVLCH